ncbi:MAG: hypothetical protein U0869_02425 [Chloroflexota bacterium]
MGARLELKWGLVAEPDRIATSADTMLVEEPVIGSKSRTKGNLYLVVSSGKVGGRARDATALIADTIRREYYYDESAGIPICLEKAVRAANRKLRGSREGAGLPPGILGIAIAVVRQSELYVATIGDAEAYLVRAARLLMPDQSQLPGLPADDALRVDVWRGELAVGDSLILVSRNLTQVVGTEELKNAVVTLHPQSAVEHLHHLFVAAGGDGSDGLISLEATELAASRSDRRPVPEPGTHDPYADLPGGPIPGGDSVAGAAGAVGGAMTGAVGAVGGAFTGAWDRFLDKLPRRSPSPRRVSSSTSRRETQRRMAIALVGLLVVLIVLGVGFWVFPRGKESEVVQLTSGERALQEAQQSATRGISQVVADPVKAQDLCSSAWAAVTRAKDGGVNEDVLAPVVADITKCLDTLYGVQHPRAQLIFDTTDMEPNRLVQGPDRSAYFVDNDSKAVWRVQLRNGNADAVVRQGDGKGGGIGTPRLLATGGADLVILDDGGNLWRWRRQDVPLALLRKPEQPVLGDDPLAMTTYVTDTDANLYYLYIVDPSENQILRYSPELGGAGFSEVSDYLATDNENVSSFVDLIESLGSIMTLTKDNLIRHYGGRVQDFKLETPPDDRDMRPGHSYRFVQEIDEKLYVYDVKWNRVLVFNRADGSYVEQWQTTGKVPPMQDLRGMYLVPSSTKKDAPPVLVWLSPDGLFQSTLVNDPNGGTLTTPEPGQPDESFAPEPTKKPKKNKAP